jgi:hypothetical protein
MAMGGTSVVKITEMVFAGRSLASRRSHEPAKAALQSERALWPEPQPKLAHLSPRIDVDAPAESVG